MSETSPETVPDYIDSIAQEIPREQLMTVLLALYNVCEHLLGIFRGNAEMDPEDLALIKSTIPSGDASILMEWGGIDISSKLPKLAQEGNTAAVQRLYDFVQGLTDQCGRRT
jgi:hypothetical protein